MSDPRTHIEVNGIVDRYGKPLPMPLDPSEWHRAWYPQVLAHRIRMHHATKHNDRAGTRARQANRALCAQPGVPGMLYYLNTFGWILEPRNESSMMRLPFITFPRQAELIEEIERTMQTPYPHELASLALIKARTVGGTWIDVGHNIKEWQFAEYWFSLVISKDENLVTNLKDPRSYFWKMKFLLQNQPKWLLPEGFVGFTPRDPNTVEGTLNNPETGSIINGSTTTPDAGRGDRRRKVTMDEAGTYDDFDAMFSNLANVTDHRFIISSAHTRHGMGLYNLVHGKNGYTKPRVFFFRWNDVPGRGEKWYRGMKATMQEEEFRREIEMEWFAGTGEFCYPMLRDRGPDRFPYQPGWPLYIAIDDGWEDRFAISWWQKDLRRGRYRCIASYSNKAHPIKFYGYLLTGTPHGSFRWTPEERRLMEHIRDCSLFEATYYGDRHGDATELTSGRSPFEVLTQEFGIVVVTANDPKRNDITYRIDAVQENLPRCDFNNDYGAEVLFESLQQLRWPQKRGSSQATSGAKAPVRTELRDLAATAEYFFINERNAWDEIGPRQTVRDRNVERVEQGMGFNPHAYSRRQSPNQRYTQQGGVYVRDAGWQDAWNGQ